MKRTEFLVSYNYVTFIKYNIVININCAKIGTYVTCSEYTLVKKYLTMGKVVE